MTPLPEQKHSDEELNELRMRNAFAVRPPVQTIRSLAQHPILLIMHYLICLTGVGLVIGDIFLPGLICSGVAMLGTFWVFWKKPRSRHHATLIAIISLLVLVFGTVYYLEQFEPTAYDAQGPIGY